MYTLPVETNIILLLVLVGLEWCGRTSLFSLPLIMLVGVLKAFLGAQNTGKAEENSVEQMQVVREIRRVPKPVAPQPYEQSEYYLQTQRSRHDMTAESGFKAEYEMYELLNAMPGYKKFIFNAYVPKGNGKTSEIDLIMLHETGVYVFESKDYKGVIYGEENLVEWKQVLPACGKARQKENYFYNPLLQNEAHINSLQNYLYGIIGVPFYSIAVFGRRAMLQEIKLNTRYNKVVEQKCLQKCVQELFNSPAGRICREQIDFLYSQLYPLMKVSDEIKKKHIENIA